MKTAPFGDVWNEYLTRENVPTDYLTEIKKYEVKQPVVRNDLEIVVPSFLKDVSAKKDKAK